MATIAESKAFIRHYLDAIEDSENCSVHLSITMTIAQLISCYNEQLCAKAINTTGCQLMSCNDDEVHSKGVSHVITEGEVIQSIIAALRKCVLDWNEIYKLASGERSIQ